MVRLGEFTLKGRNRRRFEQRMAKQVKQAIAAFPESEVLQEYGRIYIALHGLDYRPVADKLRRVFGIGSVSPVRSTEPQLEGIRSAALAVLRHRGEAEQTFKVTVRRVWKAFPHTSQEMNHLVGRHVLQQYPKLRVDVHRPQLELRVEIKENAAYVFCEVLPGVGGFPYGTNGKALLLLSGGIDSPVAGWHAMRKGLELEAIHFASPPYTSDEAKDKALTLARKLAGCGDGRMRMHIVPFTDIQTALASTGQPSLTITLMRRAMLRIAERLAERQGAHALVTGDSLGQVASQTLGSMNVIGRAAVLPLLRPLVMQDKQEIIDLAVRIGTYETSILPYEDCCTLFVPRSPSTNPNLRIVERIEHGMTDLQGLLEAALAQTETLELRAGESESSRHAAERDAAMDEDEPDWF
ncbi:tRNA 4-thiouridine(8) synthase ThiI [Paenibacillus sp. IB182496]|uniref:Probable tRNA sulfurtransferase n=1 Tax=Paenibacillus sabuli TaxID=2772509 RepID=A0A927GR56_9BACL|nr:tRNA uracil 4-sulfurtransferase ThiI [Paenibacillus sabuli]MBD2844427.1 tRNA 4-thiouridine(8) synthase ThiI [Paenibacillus sabuli]